MKILLILGLLFTGCQTVEDNIDHDAPVYEIQDSDYMDPSYDLFSIVPETKKEAYLRIHNEVRYDKELPPLVWSQKLQRSARKWALHLATEKDCKLVHSKGTGYGENLAASGGRIYPNGQPVYWWAKEEQWYDYLSNKCAPGKACGHYTQIVWRNSRELGCAEAKCADGKYKNRRVYVCQYNPPGNYVGQKPY